MNIAPVLPKSKDKLQGQPRPIRSNTDQDIEVESTETGESQSDGGHADGVAYITQSHHAVLRAWTDLRKHVNPNITQVAESLGLTRERARQCMAAMCEEGVLRRTGVGKYERTGKPYLIRRFNKTDTHRQTLEAIRAQGDPTPQSVADFLGIRYGTAHARIRSLIETGQITRDDVAWERKRQGSKLTAKQLRFVKRHDEMAPECPRRSDLIDIVTDPNRMYRVLVKRGFFREDPLRHPYPYVRTKKPAPAKPESNYEGRKRSAA